MSITFILLITAALIILALGVYAGRMLYLVQAQQNRQQAVRDKRIASMQSSIHTIAFAMQQQQCDLSEGVIRICRLLEAMPVDPHPDYPSIYPATHDLFDLVKNYPTHEARSALTKTQRRAQDHQRQEFESQLESEIIKETDGLRNLKVQS